MARLKFILVFIDKHALFCKFCFYFSISSKLKWVDRDINKMAHELDKWTSKSYFEGEPSGDKLPEFVLHSFC